MMIAFFLDCVDLYFLRRGDILFLKEIALGESTNKKVKKQQYCFCLFDFGFRDETFLSNKMTF